MAIWSVEIKELEILYESLKGHFPEVEKELNQLFSSNDPNVLFLYSRRCLETIIADICACELKKDRGTEPLKGIIDKFNKEKIVPAHIIASMHGLNELSTFGTHPKEFDPEQVKPVLINLLIVLKWYSQYKKPETFNKSLFDEVKNKAGRMRDDTKTAVSLRKRDLVIISAIIMAAMITIALVILTKATSTKIPKSIAVLPFTSLSSDTEQEYFSVGMVDEILDKLFKIGGLKVIARTSTERFRNSDLSLKEIGRKLGVATIMEGSIRRAGDNVRITVQLIDAKTEAHLWSEIYDRSISDIFMIQSDVAQNVARELKAAITPENRQLIDKTPTKNMAAWEAYQMGIFYHRRLNKDDIDAALKYFELALERDSAFSLAYTGIGRVWIARQQMGLAKASEATPKAEAAVLKALRLDSNSSEAYLVLGGVNTWGQWDWKEGEAAYRKAIELNPQNADAHSTLSHVLNVLGRPDRKSVV